MSVKIILFNNGLQIIGDVQEKVGEQSIKVTKPAQLIMVPASETNSGKVSMAFSPFMQYTEDWSKGLTFAVEDVLTAATPVVELVNSYNSSFGSGLVLPPGIGQA